MDLFTGVGVALVPRLDDAGGVDAATTSALAADLGSRGMQAVLACGTTGAPGTLTDAERLEVIRAVRDAVPPGVPVLAGTGATSLARAAELTAAAAAAGADAILAWPPPGCDDLVGYYAELGRVADGLPVLAYHIPWISSPGIPVSALAGLPVAGLKGSSGGSGEVAGPSWRRQRIEAFPTGPLGISRRAGDPSRGRSARRESSGARPWGPGKAPARSVTRHRGRKASVTPGTRQVPPASYRPQGSSRRPSGPEISDPPAGASDASRARPRPPARPRTASVSPCRATVSA